MKITMKSFTLFAGVLCMMASAACAQKGNQGARGEAGEMKTKMDSISYVFGASLGANIRRTEIEGISIAQVNQGLTDALEGDSSLLISMEDGQKMVGEYMKGLREKQSAASMEEAEAYMAEAAKDKSWKSTDSGILYKVQKEGDGPKPSETDKVRVHYEGTNTEGEVFDSSYERGQPAEFPVNRVIPGWTEMLQMMSVGSVYNVIIPPNMAYGARGSQPKIGPNEVLKFKIELLGILPKEEAPTQK